MDPTTAYFIIVMAFADPNQCIAYGQGLHKMGLKQFIVCKKVNLKELKDFVVDQQQVKIHYRFDETPADVCR